MQYDVDDLIAVRCENDHLFSIMWGEEPEDNACIICGAKMRQESD